MRLHLAPGERADAATLTRAAALLDDPRIAAVLVPLVPDGDSRTARAARRYMSAWDARLVHDQTAWAPGARVATREPLPGWRAADAAPTLQRALDEGRIVRALRDGRVETPLARDLDKWIAWAREEGAAWGALARRDPRFARLSPAQSWSGWAKHNVLQLTRRAGEVAQATRRGDAGATWLHLAREAAWTGAYVRALRL